MNKITKSLNTNMGYLLNLVLLSILPVFANANDSAIIEQDLLLDDLLQELDEVTAIATHTKLNIDYVPGMVTVLRGEDMQQAGIFTLNDALNTVPGVEVITSNEGQTKFVMRGIGESFSSGKVKFLINGRAMNAVMSAASTAGTIPMQLVERIEIIRGSGSSIYGEYAYAGVVNVIMRKDTTAYYTGSDHNKHSVGASWSNYETESQVKYAFNVSAMDSEGKQVKAGPDYFTDPILVSLLGSNISNSPGYSNEAERVFTSALQVSYKDMHWDSFIQHQVIGDYFGFLNALPPKVEPIRKVITLTSDLDKKFKINGQLNGLASAGGRIYALRGKLHHFLPDGYAYLDADNTPVIFSDGVLATPNYTEYEAHSNLELYYSGIKDHDILFGLHGAYIKQGDTWANRNWVIVDGKFVPRELQNFRGSDNWLTENNTRKVVSLYAQDQWKVIDPLTVTASARYDNYFGIGDIINPRLAAVYNLRDKHIFKIQYSHSFRPPTYLELYIDSNPVATGNANLKSERVQAGEIGYIYNNTVTNTSVRFTAFNSHLRDLIIVNNEAPRQYMNQDEVISRGAEIEMSQKIDNSLIIEVNATLMDVKDSATGEKLTNIANLLGNAKASYQINNSVKISVSDHYTGKRKRHKADTRSSLAAYHVFNTAISIKDVLVKKVTVNLGVKNILDTQVLHPSPITTIGPLTLPTYAGDYPRPGRELWLNLSYKY